MKVKTILVSQTRPTIPHSPFFELEKNRKIKIDFEPFIHVKPVSVKEIRLQKIDLTMFTAIILTSRYAVDHYFRVCEKMRYKVPDSMKYLIKSDKVLLSPHIAGWTIESQKKLAQVVVDKIKTIYN